MTEKKNNISTCPSCQTKYGVSDQLIGKTICPKCGVRFEVTMEDGVKQDPIIGKLAVMCKFINEKQLDEACTAAKIFHDQDYAAILDPPSGGVLETTVWMVGIEAFFTDLHTHFEFFERRHLCNQAPQKPGCPAREDVVSPWPSWLRRWIDPYK